MTTLDYGSKLAWPCHVACWLPLPTTKTEKLTTLAAVATKASSPGNWLTSASKNGEIITIEVLRDAPPQLKILCEGGRCLVSSPLAATVFSFALVREVLLVASLVEPSGGSTYTFGCRFMSHQHAVECAAIMKAAISLGAPARLLPTATRLQQPPSSYPTSAHPLAFSSDQQRRAELLLLENIAQGDLETAGSAWWHDFPQLVAELDKKMRRKNHHHHQQQQQQLFEQAV